MLLSVIVVLLIIVITMFVVLIDYGNLPNFPTTFFSPIGTITSTQGNPVQIQDAIANTGNLTSGARVNAQNNTITLLSTSVSLTVFMASAQGAEQMAMQRQSNISPDVFVIGGLINPTIIVRTGTTLHLTEINLDQLSPHNIMIVGQAPPYPYMPAVEPGNLKLTEPFLLPANYQSGTGGEFTSTTTFGSPGTFYYLSSYPNQAELGMYGTIIVR